ncbi:NUDIX domain-containing protein [Brevundimonas fluminis]|jgi:8-oxo-dGTP pyrophosphatase MutT (NUDIX family)|uniref:NUDIX domain-containing protein n=1 Tax=Brevundimonas fluminis TaxID=2487274 RepID=UPI000F657992|nr:NUDIX hydrolase [Brevundimonas fluminis]
MSGREDDVRPDPLWDDGSGRPPAWQDHGERLLFENPWMRLTEHRATAPTGAPADYVVMRPASLAVGVLPLHGDGTVTLVGQHRFVLMNWSWEMPEGGARPDEDPQAAAARELAEEAGLAARSWREVLRMDMSNSVTDERAVAFLAWDLDPAPTAPDPTEAFRVARVPFLDLIDAVGMGAVRDAFTVATALRAHHMAVTSQLPGWLSHVMLGRPR